MKYVKIFLFSALVLFGSYSLGETQKYNIHTKDITNMYVDYIEEWKIACKRAFEEAAKEVYAKEPNEDVVGPHEDPAKCACKGTGVIVHGDDHKTPCPFHGKSQGLHNNKEVIIKEFRR